mmetsp:Transcript_108225/g.187943  ORF Transcript_108225/g.187943 Transcript_108225/m.187943 type:complete len:651 (+) Transcript_108225:48-2000(+)
MAKTKEQRAAAHQRQLERATRKRQGGKVELVSAQRGSGCTEQREAEVNSMADVVQALLQHKEPLACETVGGREEMLVSLQTCNAEDQSQEMLQLQPYSAKITGRRRSTHGADHTRFIISVTGSDRTSTVERSYLDFEDLRARLQPMMHELPAMPPNTLQHVCIEGRYVEMREEGLQQLLAAMLRIDRTLRFLELRSFLLSDSSEIQETGHTEAVESQHVDVLESVHESIRLLSIEPFDTTEMKADVFSDCQLTREGSPRTVESICDEDEEVIGEEDHETSILYEEPCNAAVTEPAEKAEEFVDRYFVDNGELQATTDGLGYRHSKNFTDKVRPEECADWGSYVNGIEEGAEWLRVPSRNLFLPIFANGKRVLSKCAGDVVGFERANSHDDATVGTKDEDSNLSEGLCNVAATGSVEEGEVSAETETLELNVQSQEEDEKAGLLHGMVVEKLDTNDLASALEAHEEAFDTAVSLKLQTARMTRSVGGNQQTAAWLQQLGKIKLQINDVHGAIESFSNAQAIYRRCGKLQTLDGANLLRDLGAAKLQSGDANGALKACEGICEYAGSLQTPAAVQLIHDLGRLWHLLAPSSIFAAACAFLEDVNQEELDKSANRGSQSVVVEEAKHVGPLCTAFLKFGRSLLCLCSHTKTHK